MQNFMKRENRERQGLSRREREVLRFLADGNSPSEIAQALRLSLKTIQTYLLALKAEIGVAKFDPTNPRRGSIMQRANDWAFRRISEPGE
jgi:DNA-binding CsgD family transcriptional regulator